MKARWVLAGCLAAVFTLAFAPMVGRYDWHLLRTDTATVTRISDVYRKCGDPRAKGCIRLRDIELEIGGVRHVMDAPPDCLASNPLKVGQGVPVHLYGYRMFGMAWQEHDWQELSWRQCHPGISRERYMHELLNRTPAQDKEDAEFCRDHIGMVAPHHTYCRPGMRFQPKEAHNVP